MNAYERGKQQGMRFVRSLVRTNADSLDFFSYLAIERAIRAYKTFAKQEEFSEGWMSAWPGMPEYDGVKEQDA